MEKKEELAQKRSERMAGLITRPVVNKEKDIKQENNPEKPHYINYAVKIEFSELEFVRKYAYSKGLIKGRKVVIGEVILDALNCLKDHTSFELKNLPIWEIEKLKRKKMKRNNG